LSEHNTVSDAKIHQYTGLSQRVKQCVLATLNTVFYIVYIRYCITIGWLDWTGNTILLYLWHCICILSCC